MLRRFLLTLALVPFFAHGQISPVLCNKATVTPCTSNWSLPPNHLGDAAPNAFGKVNEAITALSVNAANIISYGADPTGIADSTTAINAAFAANTVVLIPNGTYSVSAPLNFTKFAGVIIDDGGLLKASSTFSGGSYVLNINAGSSRIFAPWVDGGNVTGGISVLSGSTRIFSPKVTHFTGNGIALIGSSGDNFLYDVAVQQWLNSDAQYATDANYTATGVYVNQADSYIIGGVLRWSGTNLLIDAASGTIFVSDVHLYNGRQPISPLVARTDPINAQVNNGATNIYFNHDYFDNGHIELYSTKVAFKDSFLLVNNGAVFTDSNDIRVYANGNTAPYQLTLGFLAMDLIGINPVAYLPFNSNTWSGDWSALSTVIQGAGWQNLNASSGEVFLHEHYDQATPDRIDYKPFGTIDWEFQIGAATPSKLSCANATCVYDHAWGVAGAFFTGATFSVASGTGACATTSTLNGGQAGDLKCTGSTGASTVTLTLPTLPAGSTAYSCWGRDITTPTTLTQTGAKSTSAVTLTMTSVTANDVIQFGCAGY